MDTTNQPKIPPDPPENDAADQMLPITKEPKTPADPPEKDAADHMLPISTEKEDIPDPETNLTNQPTDDPRRTSPDLTTPPASHVSCASHVPVSPMHEDIPDVEPISAHLQKLINQGFGYTPGIEAFTLYPDSEEEEEDQSIPFMEEQHISLVQHLVPFY